MKTMKIFIWEGNGISDAYHDDGTLVVLAESAEQAREVVRAEKVALEADRARPIWKEHQEWERQEISRLGGYSAELWKTPEGQAILDRRPKLEREYIVWDGTEAALNREPDTVLEIDTPKVVAFNGGGYD